MLPGVRSGFWSKSTFKPGLALKSESLGGKLCSVDFPTGEMLILPGERKGLSSELTLKLALALKSESLGDKLVSLGCRTGGMLMFPGERNGSSSESTFNPGLVLNRESLMDMLVSLGCRGAFASGGLRIAICTSIPGLGDSNLLMSLRNSGFFFPVGDSRGVQLSLGLAFSLGGSGG